MNEFSHLDKQGNVRMVDVSDKIVSSRIAKAVGVIQMQSSTVEALIREELPKGNVLTIAKIAGIQAAKITSELIPLCHQLNLSWVDLEFEPEGNRITIKSIVKTQESTGVEMEALTAVSVAALTIYDMCKAVDRTMEIKAIRLVERTGGKSTYRQEYRPTVGVITLSDSIAMGKGEDKSGINLKTGFENAGCKVVNYVVLPDGSEEFTPTITQWIADGVELILTTGGTGLGLRDLTINTIEELFDFRLPGIEQALHAYGHRKTATAMLSRLAVGVIDQSIVVCLPGSPAAVKDAIVVLIPAIFHAFHMLRGERH